MKEIQVKIKGYDVIAKTTDGAFIETFHPTDDTMPKSKFQEIAPEGHKVIAIERTKKTIIIPSEVIIEQAQKQLLSPVIQS